MFSRPVLNLRVTPEMVSGRDASVIGDDDAFSTSGQRQSFSSWACEISYVDGNGEPSVRQITCRRLSGHGEMSHVLAWCHARNAVRGFRIDRIKEMFDLSTGELLDPAEHFTLLRQTGILSFQDEAFAAFLQVVIFMAKCDGSYHPLEHEALEAAISAYCLRFDGSDEMAEAALNSIPSIAPDGRDIMKALRLLDRSSLGSRISRLVLDHCGRIMDADGRHHAQEVAWAIEIGGALKQRAVI